jgi:hypothetical protein
MTDHVMHPIPDPDGYWRKLGGIGGSKGPKQACWFCGLFDTSVAGSRQDCSTVQANPSMKHYRAGGRLDPFASMRTNTAAGAASGRPLTANPGMVLGSKGVGGSGMPIRRDVPVPDPGYHPPVVAGPKEDRPGLTEERINRDAYDDFMRGL